MSSSKNINVKKAVPFFRVHDIDKSVLYYMNGLGCQLMNQWIDNGKLRWCWLQLGDAAIMLEEFWKQGNMQIARKENWARCFDLLYL